jgi:hypothetical protein
MQQLTSTSEEEESEEEESEEEESEEKATTSQRDDIYNKCATSDAIERQWRDGKRSGNQTSQRDCGATQQKRRQCNNQPAGQLHDKTGVYSRQHWTVTSSTWLGLLHSWPDPGCIW